MDDKDLALEMLIEHMKKEAEEKRKEESLNAFTKYIKEKEVKEDAENE